MLGCITVIFFICWGPRVFYTILYEFIPDIFPQQTVLASVGYTLSLLFGMLTPIANPVFYGILNDPFKEVVRKRFPWLFVEMSFATICHRQRHSLSLSMPILPEGERQPLAAMNENQNGLGDRAPRCNREDRENFAGQKGNDNVIRLNNNIAANGVEGCDNVASETCV